MNKIFIFALLAAAITTYADDIPADYVEGEKSAALVTPEMKTAAAAILGTDAAQQLLHAVQLQMSKYDADMQTMSGRRAWHGTLVRQEIYTNELCKVEVYSNKVDGTIWRYRLPFRPVASKTWRPPVITNGIPAKLAAARLRRSQEQRAVSNITTVVSANAAEK